MDSITHTLIHKCLENDRVAQKLLYHSTKDYLMSVAYRYSIDINEAKDILQNAYIKIFHNLSSFNSDKGKFKTWASKIVVNEALQLKRKKKEFELLQEVEIVEAYTDIPALHKLTIEELSKIINMLPEVHRVILNMYYFEEYTHKEIAEILNIKSSSSRAQLSKARKLLIKKWESYNLAI